MTSWERPIESEGEVNPHVSWAATQKHRNDTASQAGRLPSARAKLSGYEPAKRRDRRDIRLRLTLGTSAGSARL